MGNLVAYDENGNQVATFMGDSVTITPDLSDSVHIGEPIKFKKQEEVTLSAKINSTAFYAMMWMVEKKMIKDILTPKHIFHNRKTAETIVIWKDGTKTVVKPMEGTPESEMSSYTAFTAALAKKLYGSNTQVNKVVSMTKEPVTKTEKQHRRKLAKQAKHLLSVTSDMKEKENLKRIAELMGDKES